MTCKVILLVISLSILLTGSAMAQFDHGNPDSLALEVSVPYAGTTDGLVTAELWAYNDADNLLGVSIGFKWLSNNLYLDSVVPEPNIWTQTFREFSNSDKTMLYAGFSFSTNDALPMGASRKKLATWYFTLSSWTSGDQFSIDTSEYFPGAEMLMSNGTGDSYVPVWAGGDSPMVFAADDYQMPRAWYVSPGGDDLFNDGTIDEPFKSFSKAFDKCNDGDTVMVLPGNHLITNSIGERLSKAITIKSTDGPEVTFLDGRDMNRIFYLSNIASPGVHFYGLTFRNGNSLDPPSGWSAVGGAMVSSSCTGSINNCIFESNISSSGSAVYFSDIDEGPFSFNSCQFYGNYAARGAVIANYSNRYITWSLAIKDCTFANNSRDTGAVILYGAGVGDGQYNISNSIFAFNGGSSLFSPGRFELDFSCTNIFGNANGDWVGNLVGLDSINNNFSADPLFCDADNQDYHINAVSPCAPANSLCGELVGALNVGCEGPAGDGEVYPTNEWISIYCPGGIIVEGEPLGPNQYIRAYDPDGVLCGIGQTNTMGQLPLFSIYRDDIYSERDEGAEPGDMITFVISGNEARAVPGLQWTANGDVTPVCEFKLERCLGIRLNRGWNLISWNVWYEAEITEALSNVMDCVDVVLGFEQGGLTFDPDLPQFSSLSQVDAYHGYWVRMNCAATLSICGPPIEAWHDNMPATIAVEAGWNLMSFWPNGPVSTENAFAQALQTEVLEVAIGFDHGAQVWLPGQANFNTLTELKPGFGYWAKMSQGFDFLWGTAMVGDSAPGDFYTGGVGLVNSRSATSESRVKIANTWVSVYGADIVLDDRVLTEGAVITFHTANGELRGEGLYQNGKLAFTPVYGPDKSDNPLVMAPVTSEQFLIRVDGNQVTQRLDWTANGDRIKLDRLTSDGNGSLPTEYSLSQNYPNPFNPNTTIGFSLVHNQHVKLTIINVLGQNVITLTDADLPAGEHQVVWDARDANGNRTASGVYFYRLETSEFTMTRKMVLTK